ncbi:M1 family aminopeptidase [Paludisphaera sp.]|uniref:M1 family aminopeptidase n=1 Tax=Paludisphaera sp. TaxID=2017432 RepID=UPI00301C8BA7
MPNIPRRLIAVIVIALAARGGPGLAQAPLGEARRPFARPGPPRPVERVRSYDVRHIKAVLTLDMEKDSLAGAVTHTIAPLRATLSRMALDCGPALEVSRVTVGPGGDEAPFQHVDETLVITLDPPRPAGEPFDVTVAYSGTPENGLRFIPPDASDPDRPKAAWTQGQVAENRHWLPCYDAPNDLATTEMIVTVARPYSVVSNGALVATTDAPDGGRSFHWKMDQPHASYLVTLAVSEFNVFRDEAAGVPVEYYVLKNVDEPTARRFMGLTPKMMTFFAEVTGQPYPYPKYAQVCLPEFNGGMENASATSMTDAALLDPIESLEGGQEGLVAHELAHQWFGDLMTCKDWSHLWLNEGFASYFDPLFFERERGEEEFRLLMRGALENYLAADRRYRRPIVETRFDNPTQLFDGMAYSKGALVLHALRGVLGDEAWWKGVRHYVATNKFRNVESEDLRKAFESATGEDLGWFFDQWVYKAGHPELKASWRYEPDDRTVRLKVEQAQKLDDQTPLFRLPTTVEIIDAPGMSRRVAVVIDGASREFVLPAESEPRAILLDPDGWIPRQTEFERSVAERRFLLEHGPNVLARLDAAEALADEAGGDAEAREALAEAWKREESPKAAAMMVEVIARGDAAFRPALLAAAASPEARVRVAAARGLAQLDRDPAAEALLREVWGDPQAPYGARQAALLGLVGWKVEDAEEIVEAALELPAGRHVLAATALGLVLGRGDARARELAAAYVGRDKSPRLRIAALEALGRLARDDAALRDVIVPLADDPDRQVRVRAWELIGRHRIRKALPILEARLKVENFGFNARARDALERAIEALKQPEPAAGSPVAEAPAKADAGARWDDLMKRLDELERLLRAIRDRVEEVAPR